MKPKVSRRSLPVPPRYGKSSRSPCAVQPRPALTARARRPAPPETTRAPETSNPRTPASVPPSHHRDVNSAIATVVEKNSCARQACAVEIHHGSSSSTVNPPSTPCAITATSATTPSHFIQRRRSARNNQTIATIVNSPTVVATMRWPCSYRIPPSIGGISLPYESGQSGTESPASRLVTSPPATTSNSVAHASRIDQRCSPGL